MEDISGQIVIPMSRAKAWFLFIASLIFVLGGVFNWPSLLKTTNSQFGVFMLKLGLALFSLAFLMSIFLLIFVRRFGLMMDEKGFTLRTPLRSTTYTWNDIDSPFVVAKLTGAYASTTQMICFNSKNKHHFLSSVNQTLVGYTSGLTNIYDINNDALAELLNSWREKNRNY